MALLEADFEVSRKRLWDELVALADLWSQFQFLFAGSNKQIDVLNACAGWFFGLTQRTFLKELLLSIARLTDPAEQRGNKNLTIRLLLEDPDLEGKEDVRAALRAEIAQLSVSCAEIRTHRQKYIAHLDHAVAIDKDNTLLPGLSREQVSNAVESLLRIYNLHARRIRSGHAVFDLDPAGGAKALVDALEGSERWKQWTALQARLGRNVEGT